MKALQCSWVDLLKIRAALKADGRRGAQSRLEQMRCVDHSTISGWKAAATVVDAIDGKCCISNVSSFQPSHAAVLARHLRKQHGKQWLAEASDEAVEWVERCEEAGWTVQEFKERLSMTLANGKPSQVTQGRIVEDLAELQGETFGCIYADPPWRYGNQATRAATSNHYPTLTVDEICAMPVRELAAAESHLWLWTTNGFLFDCPRIFDAWGFEFKSSYVWVKPQMGIGNYLRNAHEFLLLGVRGGLTGRAKDVRSWGEFARSAHSSKPEQIRCDVVERASPGPYLELFGRRAVQGWCVFGNQVGRCLFTQEVVNDAVGD